MIRAVLRAFARLLVLPSILIGGSVSSHAQDALSGHQRVQQISLNKGWNAVYLEVQPADSSPAAVFNGLPVDKVATLFEAPVSNQFVSDPGVNLFKGNGWGVWYAPGQPEAFLKSLDAIDGNRAYLVHAKQACQWRAAGRVTMRSSRWRPDSFNFTGFAMSSSGGPTFAQFFAGSKAHKGQTIYRLAEGRWRRVLQPAAESMRSGEAFWVFCKGASDFQGPLSVETASSFGLLLGRGTGAVILRNACPHPLTPQIRHVPGDAQPLPLSIMVRTYGSAEAPVKSVPVSMPAGNWEQPLPPLEIGASISIPFERRVAEMRRPEQGSLLQITTDLGTETWVPVYGFRNDSGD